MPLKSKFRILQLVVLGLALFLFSCGSGERNYGTYIAEPEEIPKPGGEPVLELKENGAGMWRMGDEEVSFSWHMKGDQLRIHTKTGGVIVGDFQKEVIILTIPGSKTMSFKKVK